MSVEDNTIYVRNKYWHSHDCNKCIYCVRENDKFVCIADDSTHYIVKPDDCCECFRPFIRNDYGVNKKKKEQYSDDFKNDIIKLLTNINMTLNKIAGIDDQ